MNKHQCIIGIGSNHNAEQNIPKAIIRLKSLFPGIVISTPVKTVPIGIENANLFINCTGIVETSMNKDEITELFKSIEIECGRNAFDKSRGIISLDIDLLKIDHYIIKAEDYQRSYIQEGLKELNHE